MPPPLTSAAQPMYKFCMIGTIRTKQKCPVCQGKFTGSPLQCLSCRTTPTKYYLDFHFQGQRIRVFCDNHGFALDSWPRADRLLNSIRLEMDEKTFDPRDYAPKEIKSLRFSAYIQTWITRRTKEIDKAQLSRSYLQSIKVYSNQYLIPFFQKKNIRDLHEGMIEDFQAQLPDKLSPKTVANILGILHKLMADAFRRHDITRMPAFPRVKISEPKTKWITEEEQTLILEQITNPIRQAFFLFLMKQGCRPGEARALRWEHLDLQKQVVCICAAMDQEVYRESTKEGDIRYLPLHEEVIEALKKLPRSISGFVFTHQGNPIHRQVIRKTWNAAAEKAGIDITCYQGTKHSLGGQAVNDGVDLVILKKMFGHKDIRSTERYAKLQTESLRQVWDRHQATVTKLSPRAVNSKKDKE